MENFRRLKKIIFINQTLSEGGAERFNLQLLTWFKKHNIEVSAWTTLAPFRKKLKKNGIEAKRIPIVIDIIGDWKGLLKGILLFIPGIFYYGRLVFQNRNGGVIFLSGYIEKILVTPWARLLNVPVIWVEHGPLEPILGRFFGFPKVLYNFAAKFPDYVITPSNFSLNCNLDISGIDKTKMIVVNDGIVPLEKYSSKVVKHTAYCVSRLEKGKGQDILIKAWVEVIKKFPDAKLFIIGTGDFRENLEKIISDYNLQKNVILTGWVEDFAKIASQTQVGIFPSTWKLEGFGVVLLEAMSLEKPIVCFNHGPYPEVVDRSYALIVKKEDPISLSIAIIKLFSDTKLSEELGKNGKKIFNEKFTIEKIGEKYGEIFERAVEDRLLFKNCGKFSIYIYDLVNKGLLIFLTDRIKKRKFLRTIFYLFAKNYVMIRGKKLFINKMDTVISERLMNEGVWEPGTTKVINKYLEKSKLVVDIGANLGYYTLIAADKLKKSGKVIAFEPSQVNFGLLSKTIDQNKLTNVELVQKAIGAKSERKYLYSGSENFGDRKMFKGSINESKEAVQVITLDEYFSNNEKIDLLKIDIEGYEAKAFAGAKSLLSKGKIKVIISELRPESMEMAGDDWVDYIEMFQKCGFDIFDIAEESGYITKFSMEEARRIYANDKHMTINILAILK